MILPSLVVIANDTKEGFMSHSIAFVTKGGKSPFEKISKTFLEDPHLFFAKVLPGETIEKTFRKYNNWT